MALGWGNKAKLQSLTASTQLSCRNHRVNRLSLSVFLIRVLFCLFFLQMKLTLFTLTACCCVAITLAAISEIKNNNSKASATGDPKGRFLTLPVPQKCSSREYFYFLFFTHSRSSSPALTHLLWCFYDHQSSLTFSWTFSFGISKLTTMLCGALSCLQFGVLKLIIRSPSEIGWCCVLFLDSVLFFLSSIESDGVSLEPKPVTRDVEKAFI